MNQVRNLSSEMRAAIALMRPAQWPILSMQLLVGVVFALPPLAGAEIPVELRESWPQLVMAWLTWVVMLNGGTLAFNSAYDQDTGPVAYLANPPQPPAWLAKSALAIMVLGAGLALVWVGLFFALVLAGCVALSVLYSHPATRWKSRPGLDLLVNIIGYGAGTTLAGVSALGASSPTPSGWWLALGFGLFFGSFYPLTQIYQIDADRKRGDRTLTTACGTQGSLVLAIFLGMAGGMALLLGCLTGGRQLWVSLVIGAAALWTVHLSWWLLQAKRWDEKKHERGMYRALMLWAVLDLAVALTWLRG